MRSRFSIPILVLLLAWCISAAQPQLGGRSGVASRSGFGADAIGFGGARAAISRGDVSSLYNPALAPFQSDPVLHATASTLSLDRSVYGITYANRLPPSAGLALTAMSAGTSDIQGRDHNGNPTETYSVREMAAGLAFGLRPSPRVTIGVGLRIWRAQLLPDLSTTTVGLDLGATYLVTDDVLFAAVLRDLNAKYRWDTSKIYGRSGNSTIDPFPRRLVLAAGWMPSALPFMVSAEAENVAGGWLLRTGAEWSLHESLSLRAGFDDIDPSSTIGTRWSVGLTVGHTGLSLDPAFDYSFESEPYAPTGAHHFSIRLHFRR